jgi:hypothetical protein
MQLPLTDPDTLFEELLQDLPSEVAQMAREFKGFVRAKKVKTPEQLLRMVLLYCGLDKSLRTVAGVFTALYEPLTDQSVAERLRACGPWVKALLRRMLPLVPVAALVEGRRLLVIDASTVQAPGALPAPTIACTSVWIWCPWSLSRCWSPMSIVARHSSTSP